MPLPSAVKRKAEQARQLVAERNGAQAQNQSPQQRDSEYLDVSALDSQQPPSRTVSIGNSTADVLTGQFPNNQTSQHNGNPAQRADDTRRPHVLSADASSADDGIEQEPTEASQAASQADTSKAHAPAQATPDFIDPEDYKARYAALRDKRDQRVSELESELSQLKAVNAQLESRLATPEEQPATRFELDEKTRQTLGEDQAKVFDQFNDSIEQRFAQRELEDRERAARVVQKFESNLESLVPRWREINTDPMWLDWLDKPDEVLKVRRQDMLDGFVRDQDADSVAALFRSFAAGSGNSQQRNGHSLSPELSATRAGSGMGAEEQLVEIWSQSEIADFYQAKNRLYQSGKLIGDRLQQVMAEEAKIRKAVSEGRVDFAS